MSTLAPKLRRAAAEATLHLPFHIPPKDWFGPREAGAILGVSERMVEKLFAQGTQLSGFVHNAASGKRPTIRIPRIWLVAYAVQAARFDDQTLDDALLACLRHRPAASLLKLSQAALRLAAERPPAA